MALIELNLNKKHQIVEYANEKYKVEIKRITETQCPCGCGEMVKPPRTYFSDACKMRCYRIRHGM